MSFINLLRSIALPALFFCNVLMAAPVFQSTSPDFSGGAFVGVTGGTIGISWAQQFTLSSSITFNQIGIWADPGNGTGGGPATLQIIDSLTASPTILASTQITAPTTDFEFVSGSVASTTLSAGTYYIFATANYSDGGSYFGWKTNGDGPIVGPGTLGPVYTGLLVGAAPGPGDLTLNPDAGDLAFSLDQVATSEIPEPTTVLLSGVGLALVAYRRRKCTLK
jgi:hypothetical protein